MPTGVEGVCPRGLRVWPRGVCTASCLGNGVEAPWWHVAWGPSQQLYLPATPASFHTKVTTQGALFPLFSAVPCHHADGGGAWRGGPPAALLTSEGLVTASLSVHEAAQLGGGDLWGGTP